MMSAPFRAADEAARLPSTVSVILTTIAQHNRAIQDLVEDLERVYRSGTNLSDVDGRIGAASDFCAQNGRRLNAIRTGDTEAVRLADFEFLKRYAPASPARVAAE